MSSEESKTDLLENTQSDKAKNETSNNEEIENKVETSEQDKLLDDEQKEEEKPELTELEKLQLEIQEKEKEIASLKDKNLRIQAQAANDRKRYKADADMSAFETKKRFLKRVLDIRDNIERALASFDLTDEKQKTHAEGITMIATQFDDMFSIEGIQEMKAKGEMYDLLKHEVVSRVPYNGPENRVIDVVQKGYLMNNKVLRVAKVILSMKPPKEEPKQKEHKNKDKNSQTE